jgi:hypothetical protein
MPRNISRTMYKELMIAGGKWSRADQVHVSLQDIQELRQLIKSEFPEDPPHPGYSLKISAFPFRSFLFTRTHGSELFQFERLSTKTNTILDKKHGA